MKTKNPKTPMQCLECNKKFNKVITDRTYEVRCPRCKGYDTEVACNLLSYEGK